jgi:hypothetical protein
LPGEQAAAIEDVNLVSSLAENGSSKRTFTIAGPCFFQSSRPDAHIIGRVRLLKQVHSFGKSCFMLGVFAEAISELVNQV